jgi:hypothetical protein
MSSTEHIGNPTLTSGPPPLLFSSADIRQAVEEWNANCGPASLAACLGLDLGAVRSHLGDFASKGYMNPTAMKAALARLGAVITYAGTPVGSLAPSFPRHGLVLVQFAGPWTAKGSNPRWAARHTHWVASRQDRANLCLRWVFDINAGWLKFNEWQDEVVPMITKTIPRADGGWQAANRWEVQGSKP